ncbi:MAG TPA: MASE1 domain-containing protein, partial [Verrucomicrobiae bacterium]
MNKVVFSSADCSMSAVALDDPRLEPSRFAELWPKAALFGVAYVVCAVVGDHLSVRGSPFITFWLPAGLYLAVLLLYPTRNWPWMVLTALAANLVFDLLHGTKFLLTFCFFCANTVQALTGAWLLRKLVVERPTLATLKEFFGLAGFAALFSTMLGAAIGVATLVHFGFSHSFGQSWKIWWGSNAMAILLLTTFIFVWLPKSNGAGNVFRRPEKLAEAILLFIGFSLYVWYLLTTEKGIMSPNKALAIPLLLWAGLRFGPRGATAASLFIALPLAFFTTQFSIGLTPAQIANGDYIFPLQTVLAMASLVSLIPAIVLGERNRTLVELREGEERLKNLSAAAFEGICISENGRILDANNQFVAMLGYARQDEIIGRQIIEFVAPEWRNTVAERIRAGQETIYRHQVLSKDGSIFSVESKAKTVRVGERTLRTTALRDITKRKRIEAERATSIEREQQTRVEYTFQLIASQEAERTRIARELHDGLGQNLLLIKNRAQLEMAGGKLPKHLREEFQSISDIASQTIAEIRQISHDLRPPQLDILGLIRVLQSLIENAGESSAIAITEKFDAVDDVFLREAAT